MSRFDDWTQENTEMGRPNQTMAEGDPRRIESLMQRAREKMTAMTPEELRVMWAEQRASWVRGELGMGSDRDEADARDRYRAEQRDKG